MFTPESLIGGDIRRDFLSVIAPDCSFENLDNHRKSEKESLPASDQAIFRAINQTVPYWRDDGLGVNNLNLRLKESVLSQCALSGPKATLEQAAVYQERFATINRSFSEKYFDARELFSDRGDAPMINGAPAYDLHDVEEIIEQNVRPILASILGFYLDESTTDSLRDLALSIEQSGSLDLTDALVLMEVARKYRPKGPLINSKLKEWREKLRED